MQDQEKNLTFQLLFKYSSNYVTNFSIACWELTVQFRTIIFASSDTPNVGDHDGNISETKLTKRQHKILNLIKESPTITGKQMSEILSVSQRTIERDISALQKIGKLRHAGKDNDGMWVIVKKVSIDI